MYIVTSEIAFAIREITAILCIQLYRLFKCIWEYMIEPFFTGLGRVLTALWRAFTIVGGYIWKGLVLLWPILYENAIVPLIKRNFGLILNMYPEILIIDKIAHGFELATYYVLKFIQDYVFLQVVNLLIKIIEILVKIIQKIGEVLIIIIKGISKLISLIWKYTIGFVLK